MEWEVGSWYPRSGVLGYSRLVPLPHLHRDRNCPFHICTGTGLAPPTSAPGPECWNGRLGRHVFPHERADGARTHPAAEASEARADEQDHPAHRIARVHAPVPRYPHTRPPSARSTEANRQVYVVRCRQVAGAAPTPGCGRIHQRTRARTRRDGRSYIYIYARHGYPGWTPNDGCG